MKYKFQDGGDFGSTDLFNQLLDVYAQSLTHGGGEEDIPELEEVEEDPYDPRYEELATRYSELEEKFNILSTTPQNLPTNEFSDDAFLNFLFPSDSKLPVNWDAAPVRDSRPAHTQSHTSAPQSFREEIGKREGNYNSVSRNSSGTGKYQFLWGIHGENIKKVTGVRSREEFLSSPDAQERFFSHWDQTTLSPEAEKLLPQLKQHFPDITPEQAKMMIHFGGAGNVRKAIKSGDFTSPLDANGTSLKKYVFRQTGGYASTPAQRFEGLNNPAFDSMVFPMQGTNTFRGLDSGEPVLLQDSVGKQQILFNNQHTASMKGTVYEIKL